MVGIASAAEGEGSNEYGKAGKGGKVGSGGVVGDGGVVGNGGVVDDGSGMMVDGGNGGGKRPLLPGTLVRAAF